MRNNFLCIKPQKQKLLSVEFTNNYQKKSYYLSTTQHHINLTQTTQTQLKMCTSTSTGLVNRNGPGSAASSTISDIVKGTNTTGKTKCIECDGYECCCIPIPCTVM
ncbi:4e5b290d-182d-4079-9b7b-c7c7cd8c29e8-CDS [Sclerotinia trifoliorum]|uniref:4e5b290d-182d-4079-9b7b-c7c7cd8c29e8-CDS n=1 Tax=Sclerotinia trifoliorum TaxID=28548 RepID=A0A8H2ZUE4_9HELO|nr:4e5b290d-182d-4079-9b7b-c7c7cd8c29e8-CDS [Sclerotinia trifoliorum]